MAHTGWRKIELFKSAISILCEHRNPKAMTESLLAQIQKLKNY